MADEAQILFGLTKPELFRATETLVLAVVAILMILLVIRPLVNRMLEAAREARLSTELSKSPTTVIRHVVVDYSKLPMPKLWIRALQLYGFAAFCFGLGLGLGLNGLVSFLLRLG
jgi:hypothetical protein